MQFCFAMIYIFRITVKHAALPLMLIGVMLFFSYYLEYEVGLSPCIICEVQRFVLLVLLVISIFILLEYNLLGHVLRIFRFLLLFLSIFLGWHHISLTHLSDTHAEDSCLPDILTIFKFQGFDKAWSQILHGGASCHKVTWLFMGFNLAELTLIAYSFLLLVCLWEFQCFRKFLQ